MIRTLGCLPALIRPPFRCSTVPLQARARNGTTTATLRVIYPATNLGPGRATQQAPQYHANWPWLKGFNGEFMLGNGQYSVFARVWIDQDLKQAMGH